MLILLLATTVMVFGDFNDCSKNDNYAYNAGNKDDKECKG